MPCYVSRSAVEGFVRMRCNSSRVSMTASYLPRFRNVKPPVPSPDNTTKYTARPAATTKKNSKVITAAPGF